MKFQHTLKISANANRFGPTVNAQFDVDRKNCCILSGVTISREK